MPRSPCYTPGSGPPSCAWPTSWVSIAWRRSTTSTPRVARIEASTLSSRCGCPHRSSSMRRHSHSTKRSHSYRTVFDSDRRPKWNGSVLYAAHLLVVRRDLVGRRIHGLGQRLKTCVLGLGELRVVEVDLRELGVEHVQLLEHRLVGALQHRRRDVQDEAFDTA